MTLSEINFALEQRMPVVMPRVSVPIMRPMSIRGLTKVRRSEFDEERGLDGYYWEVQLIDANGRGWINASPEQLDPAEPERFAAMLEEYQRFKTRGSQTNGGI